MRRAFAERGHHSQSSEDRVGGLECKSVLESAERVRSFDTYIWDFVGGKPIVNKTKSTADIVAKTEISDAISKDLRKRGFNFVGSTIMYAFMQATGMVNDHLT